MPPKLLPRVKVEVYFLNGAGRPFLLDPKVDKLIETHAKFLIVERANPKCVVKMSREFIAYYSITQMLIDAVDKDNKLTDFAPEPERELDLL